MTAGDDAAAAYRAARDAAVAVLDELTPLVDEPLDATVERLRDGRFVLAVVGEFSSGKSFLLNALLGQAGFEERAGAQRIVGLLKTDVNPSTATITELAYSPEPRATAFYPDGREERIPLGRLSRFVAVAADQALHDATEDEGGAPTLVRVGIDSPFLRGGFVVADTPGLASVNPAHRRATLGYLPGADAVLYLIDTQQPFTEGDASFLGIVRRYIESVFIVQTKIDLWRGREGGREAWQTATQRIVERAAIHAPGTPVFPLSAREYAEGTLRADETLLEQSRFRPFLAALDASLVATTGRARLRRAAAHARRAATRTGERLGLAAAALETPPATLRERRAELVPALLALDAAAGVESAALRALGASVGTDVLAAGERLRADLRRHLLRAFDTADVARLRDRPRLHVLVDDVVASTVGAAAATLADGIVRRYETAARDASAALARVNPSAAEPLPFAEAAALAFEGDPQSGAWSGDVATAIRSTIVLGALGGPAVALVEAIAARVRAAPADGYMKRELLGDLDAGGWEAFDRDVAADLDRTAERLARIGATLADRLDAVPPRVRTGALDAIDDALAAAERGDDRDALASAARARSERVAALATRLETLAETFARRGEEARREQATPLDLERGRTTVAPGDGARFDPATYEHGLRPERWRVVLLGGLRRGKSALINAIAGERLLRDEGMAEPPRFPVHVRYGPETRASCLADDATWEPLPLDDAMDAATRAPVLIETPWRLPKQLVLVHAPPFDAGDALEEEIALAAASAASEVLALFSRQLSDRELALYARVGESGKPMSFVHTMADLEESADRRLVVELADRYLRERGIVPQRLFTVSTRDTKAGWNEFDALVATLEAHAEEHMGRLARAERDAAERARLDRRTPAGTPETPPPRRGILGRLFGNR